ncbi:MAG: hypothetical protein RIS76_4439, partial [Verrucomicrobiota bacterium]
AAAFLAIPTPAKMHAREATTTGTWQPFGEFGGNMGMTATADGSSLYLGYMSSALNNMGAFTVTIDGVNRGTIPCTGAFGNRTWRNGPNASIPFSAGPNGDGTIVASPLLLRVSGLSEGTHTLVVTASVNPNPVTILWASSSTIARSAISSSAGPSVWVGGTLRSSTGGYAGGNDTAAEVFTEIQSRVSAELAADGLQVHHVRSGTYFDPTIAMSSDNVHPDALGHRQIADSFLEAIRRHESEASPVYDGDYPTNSLTITLVSGPPGLTVSPSGIVSWIPTTAQAGSSNAVVVRVSDNGTPQWSGDLVFSIAVRDFNTSPELSPIADRTVDELTPLSIVLNATDANVPPQTLTYSLTSGPDGLSVSAAGNLVWTPTEAQGPGSYPVVVRVTDNGNPAASAERGFAIAVNEVNAAPELAVVANQTVDELSLLSFNLSATDADRPAQTLTYALVSGPEGLSVSTAGVVAWTATEAQSPGNYPVVVRVTDNGNPAASAEKGFAIAVTEVNAAPELAVVPNQTVDELSLLSFNLSATDADQPAQTLTYTLVSGPEGLSVSTAGVVAWTPTEAQGPGNHLVVVRATDNGNPTASAETGFAIAVHEVADPVVRTVWQIGTDNSPTILPYRPAAEFSQENNRNDVRPGRVTRLPGDPQYVAATNPTADDDFYFAGNYPGGFNGLPSPLNVPYDEPPVAWERAHTSNDRTNRLHFVLTEAQVTPQSTFLLSFELVSGGSMMGGVVQPGFADHDFVVNVRNAAGIVTPLFSQRVSQTTNIVIPFTASAVAALVGANTIEIVRTGPTGAGVSYWIQYDYLRLESRPVGNTAPILAATANRVVDELVPLSLALSATDTDVPAQTLTYSRLSGPEGLSVSPAGLVTWTPTEGQGPGTYTVEVRVTDNGFPTQSDSRQFTVQVNEVADLALRTVWQVGIDNLPTVSPYRPTAEFSPENNRNDLPPGKVTRLTGDPQFVAATNPTADDDFYFAGLYPTGFNGLASSLSVPNDEPFSAWERAQTGSDRTNRMHFTLDPAQVAPGSAYRFSFELVFGGSSIGGVVQAGFGIHDMVVNFRNSTGSTTSLFAQRVTQTTNVVINFTAAAVGAMAGANSIEIVRAGPTVSGTSSWINDDYFRLENLSNEPAPIGSLALTRVTPAPIGSDGNGAAWAPSDPGNLRLGLVSQGGREYLTLTVDRAGSLPSGSRYQVESSTDLSHWTETPAVTLSVRSSGNLHTTTLQDTLPLDSSDRRFLRVQLIANPLSSE